MFPFSNLQVSYDHDFTTVETAIINARNLIEDYPDLVRAFRTFLILPTSAACPTFTRIEAARIRKIQLRI